MKGVGLKIFTVLRILIGHEIFYENFEKFQNLQGCQKNAVG